MACAKLKGSPEYVKKSLRGEERGPAVRRTVGILSGLNEVNSERGSGAPNFGIWHGWLQRVAVENVHGPTLGAAQLKRWACRRDFLIRYIIEFSLLTLRRSTLPVVLVRKRLQLGDC